MDHLLASTVRMCPLLCPDVAEERLQRFHEALYADMKPITFERRMVILSKNDLGMDLYFLLKGQVHALATYTSRTVRADPSTHPHGNFHGNSNPNSTRDQLSMQHTLFPIVTVGSLFGEQCLLERRNEAEYVASSRVRSQGRSEIG